nr:MAG TPA: hypothetical protein [Caudoviricetes sp.]
MRDTTYYVTINIKDKEDKIKRIKCGSRNEISSRLTQLHLKGITSYTFTLMKNGNRYKDFNLEDSLMKFIKYLPLIKEGL